MIYIHPNRQIAIQWTVLREKGVMEDFTNATDIACFLITPSKERKLISTDKENPHYIIIPYSLDEGTYSIEFI